MAGLSAGQKANVQRSTSNAQRSIQKDAENRQPPIALTIAGSDSSAGAGIQADLKTFSAFGAYGLTAVTCVVAETPGKVSRIEPLPADMVRAQIDLLFKNFPVAASKTGLLCSAEIVSAVAQSIKNARKHDAGILLLVDPVMIATSGHQLLRAEAVEVYEKELFPLATLVTPNLDEAAELLGRKIEGRDAMEHAARDFAKKYGVAVLLKGGHLKGDTATDFLCRNGRVAEFSAPFIRGVATHGTGCTYSAAITAGLASGCSLEKSIEQAKTFVTESIRNHFEWNSKSGNKIQALSHRAQL
jgi:hydroxymethylpyrimidine/phosphomethylpyrimidine kinase